MKIAIVGDSHVEALGPMLTDRLSRLGHQVITFNANRGWSTDRYNKQANVQRLIRARGEPDAVVISLGGNGRPSSEASYRRILSTMVSRVRSAFDGPIVWVGPATSLANVSARSADAHRRHEQNAEWQRRILPGLGVSWIDSRPMTTSGHAPDGVHFTLREGYPRWADHLAHEITHRLAGAGPRGFGPKTGAASSIWVPVAIVGGAAVVAITVVVLTRLYS